MSAAPPVFLSARFRSGSTLLWLLAKRLPRTTAYYEPLHDNLVAHVRGATPPMESHPGVVDYWEEYRRLPEPLESRHRNAFGVDRLLLEPTDAHPELEGYLRFLLGAAAGTQPVLQFNRTDFRLPWLRARFPEARIIHMHRDPVAQWLSMVRGVPEPERDDPSLDTDYELSTWAYSLSEDLPFLLGPHVTHPYQRHWMMWRLSLLMGRRCSDLSLAFEDFDGGGALEALLEAMGRERREAELLRDAVRPRSPVEDPRPASFYRGLEAPCQALLAELGLEEGFGLRPLAELRAANAAAWERSAREAERARRPFFSTMLSRMRSRYLDAVARMREMERVSLEETARRVEADRRLEDRHFLVMAAKSLRRWASRRAA